MFIIVLPADMATTLLLTCAATPGLPPSQTLLSRGRYLTSSALNYSVRPSSISHQCHLVKRHDAQIASRLEYLVDSTEPEHIMQVMKATDKIRVKKLHLAALTEESWRVKRKVSKIRKLQAKIEKLTQSVLKNLRGDNNEQEQ